MFNWQVLLLFTLKFSGQITQGLMNKDSIDFDFEDHSLYRKHRSAQDYSDMEYSDEYSEKNNDDYSEEYCNETEESYENHKNHATTKIPAYVKMLHMVRDDAKGNPIAPEIRMVPNFGLAAIYRQPVSKKTEKMIKKVSGDYAKSAQKTYNKMGLVPFVPPSLLFNNNNNNQSKTNATIIHGNSNKHKKVKQKTIKHEDIINRDVEFIDERLINKYLY